MRVFEKEGLEGDSAEIGCEKGLGQRVGTAISHFKVVGSFGGKKKHLAVGGEKNRLHFFSLLLPFGKTEVK